MLIELVRTSVTPRNREGGKASIGIGINMNVASVDNKKAQNPIEVMSNKIANK